MRYPTLLALVALSGCGYHFAGEQRGLPDDIHSLSVGTVVNHSQEYGLEKTLAFTFEREIHERGHFQMVEDPGGGDAVLTGSIRDVRVRPVAFDANDQAVQYEMTVILELTLTRHSDGQVLWHVHDLRELDEYSVSSSVVVTSSSKFQRETLNASDVQNPRFSHIQLGETERRRALTRLLKQAARDAYNQMVEAF
ncbi:MAG: LPS assembly lipoprotein LptE [Candidatus Binatia bacterium]